MRRKDIAIVGLGCVYPGAKNVREYWSNIVNGVDCIGDPPPGRLEHARNFDLPKDHIGFISTARGGFLPNGIAIDPLKYGLLPKSIKDGDADQFIMLSVIDQALQDAGIAEEDPRRARTDVIIGRGGYPTACISQLAYNAEVFDMALELLQRRYPHLISAELRQEADQYMRSTMPEPDPMVLATAIPNLAACRAANRLNLGGTAHTVDAACASSMVAVEEAMDRLRSGRADLAIAGGFFLTQWLCFAFLFQRLGAISQSGVIRPMDRRADGLLIGEGGGAVVLKRLEDAIDDGDRIYAILKGIGTSSDGRETDVLAPSSNGQVVALERAYEDAVLDKDSIGYLELHGTGTRAGDSTEIASLKSFFGEIDYPATARAMGTVKSMIGHAMPASGVASLIRVALALSNKVLPPTLHCEQPHPDLEGAPFYINSHTRPWIRGTTAEPRRAGVNSFGFGGTNVHAVLEEVLPPKKVGRTRKLQPRPIETMIHRETEIALFAAPDVGALKRRLQQLLDYLDQDCSGHTLVDVAAALARQVELKHPCKLAVIAEDLDALHQRIETSLKQLDLPEPTFNDEQIYFSASAAKHPGKIAFIFPGMGFPGLIGNYPDHLLELCLHDPDVRSEFDFFEERDRHPDDHVPTSSIFSPPASLAEEYRQQLKNRLAPPKTDSATMYQHLPEERYLAAMGVTLANWIGWTMLKKLNIPVDMVTGQSQGEMAAVCAAGVCDFHGTAPAYWRALNVNPNYSARGRLAFVWATPERVQPLLDACKDAYIAIHMSPEALILGGDRDELSAIIAKLKEDRVLCQLLPYPPIHTPSLSYMVPELNAALADMDFNMQKPKIALYSSTTAAPYPTDPKGIRETLTYNVDRPLCIWQTVRRMYDDGARVFVQVGGGHMSSHLKDLVPNPEETLTVGVESDTRNPITQLNHLVGGLFAGGVSLNPLPLFENRRIQEIGIDQPVTALPAARLMIPVRPEWTPLSSPLVPPVRQAENSVAAAPLEAPVPNETTPVGVSKDSPQPERQPTVQPAGESPEVQPIAEPLEIELDRSLPVLGQYGEVLRFVPEQEVMIRRPIDLEKDLYLHDHVFVNAPMQPPQENLAVVPMTMTMEFIAEAAALLCPEKGLIGYEGLRAIRWIGLEDKEAAVLEITAKVIGDDPETGVRRVEAAVEFEGKRSFSAIVLFAENYRHDLQFEMPDISGAGAWPFAMEDLYVGKRLFHGPRFHTVESLGGFDTAQAAATATLVVLPKDNLYLDVPEPTLQIDPSLFDACGQMAGLLCQAFDWCVLPAAVDRIEIYCPPPPPGTRCPVWLHLLELNPDSKVARLNIVLGDGSGGVWAQFAGWTDWMFKWAPAMFAFLRRPETTAMCTELLLPDMPADAVCMAVMREDLTLTKLEWFPRTALARPERDILRSLTAKADVYRFSVRHIALKDAARVWNARRTETADQLIHPSELQVAEDESGRPMILSPYETPMPQLSVSLAGDITLAVASGTPIGIDAAAATADLSETWPEFATEEEVQALDTLAAEVPDAAWLVRLRCAKAAAAKVHGAGLPDEWKRYQMIEADADGRMTFFDSETGRAFFVSTCAYDQWIVALARETVLAEETDPAWTAGEASQPLASPAASTET